MGSMLCAAPRLLAFVLAFALSGCKKDASPPPTSAAAASGKEKGARGDKPSMQMGAPISLAAVIDGKPAGQWTRAEMSTVTAMGVAGAHGDRQRSAWSLRDLGTTLVGRKAMVTELIGEGGGKMAIAPALWKDASKQPVLRQNRRGIL